MKQDFYCQSCGMPLDNPDIQGTEIDGTKSDVYCTYCYRDGAFVNPDMTLAGMEKIVKEQMETRDIDATIIDRAILNLPTLKRWKPVVLAR